MPLPQISAIMKLEQIAVYISSKFILNAVTYKTTNPLSDETYHMERLRSYPSELHIQFHVWLIFLL